MNCMGLASLGKAEMLTLSHLLAQYHSIQMDPNLKKKVVPFSVMNVDSDQCFFSTSDLQHINMNFLPPTSKETLIVIISGSHFYL